MSVKKFIALVLSAIMILALAACTPKKSESEATDAVVKETVDEPTATAPAEETSPAEKKKIRVGFSSVAFFDEWCKNLATTFETLAATDEYSMFEPIVLDGNGDVEKQINTIESLIQQDCDYIAAQPLSGTEPALAEVNAAKIPLFCVDMVPSSDAGLTWTQVGVDEKEFGRIQARKLAEALPENATVCIVMNTLGMNSQIHRTAGFEEEIAALRPDIEILDKQTSESKTEKAMNLVEDWIQRFGEDGINAIVSQSQMSTQGIIESLRAHGLVGKVLVASVDCPTPAGGNWLAEGATIVDVFYDYEALVRGVYDAILAHEKDGSELPANIAISPLAVTIDNAADFQ